MGLPKFPTLPSRYRTFYILCIIHGISQLLLFFAELWVVATFFGKWVDGSEPYTFWIFVYFLYLSIYHGTFYASFCATRLVQKHPQSRQEAVDRIFHNLSHLGAFKSKAKFDFYVGEFIEAVRKPDIFRKWGSWSMYSWGRTIVIYGAYPMGTFIAYWYLLVLLQEDGYPIILKELAWVLMGVLVASSLASLPMASNVGWASGMRGLVNFVNRDINSVTKVKGDEAAAEELQGWIDELAGKFPNNEAGNQPIVEKQVLDV